MRCPAIEFTNRNHYNEISPLSFILYIPYFVGGGIAGFGNHLLVAIRRAVVHRSLPPATTHLSINFSRVGSNVGVMGAISLALDYLFAIEDNLHPVV